MFVYLSILFIYIYIYIFFFFFFFFFWGGGGGQWASPLHILVFEGTIGVKKKMARASRNVTIITALFAKKLYKILFQPNIEGK